MVINPLLLESCQKSLGIFANIYFDKLIISVCKFGSNNLLCPSYSMFKGINIKTNPNMENALRNSEYWKARSLLKWLCDGLTLWT